MMAVVNTVTADLWYLVLKAFIEALMSALVIMLPPE